MRAREVNRRIERLGGFSVRQVGSHRRYVAEYVRSDGSAGRCSTTVAQHARDMPAGTLRQIEKDLEPAFGKGWLR
jgi:predicted RNA binding protein YcfA (HicA-like mRNA interferase family)